MSAVAQNSAVLRLGALTLMLGLVSFVPLVLRAQGNNRVSGLVTDQTGAVVLGATVTAREVDTNAVTSTTANAGGYYLLQLPIGIYNIKASNPGFQASLREKVDVGVGADIGIDFGLSLASATQAVDVV